VLNARVDHAGVRAIGTRKRPKDVQQLFHAH